MKYYVLYSYNIYTLIYNSYYVLVELLIAKHKCLLNYIKLQFCYSFSLVHFFLFKLNAILTLNGAITKVLYEKYTAFLIIYILSLTLYMLSFILY